MNRARGAFAAVFVVVAVLPPVAIPPSACAGEGPRAVLVVDTERPGGQYRLCVALPDSRVTGIELIELAGRQHGLDYRLGFGGEAVCMLAGVGAEGDDCFSEYPDFWGYWHGDDSGGWVWSGSGAGSSAVEDGDVEGWSWGSGNDASSHPQPPETEFSAVCPADRSTTNDPPVKQGSSDKNEERGTGAPAAAAAVEEDPAVESRERDRKDTHPTNGDRTDRPRKPDAERDPSSARSRRDRAGVTSSPLGAVGSGPTGTEDPTGPPVAGVAALGASVALGIAGSVLLRRRRQG